MDINVTLLFQMVAFGLFVWFVMSKVWPPLATAMAERQKRIEDGLAAADQGAHALEEAAKKAEAELAAVRSQAQEILANANKQAAEMVDQAKGQAQTEADRIKKAAQEEVKREVTKAKEELSKQVGALAVQGASKILKREIDASAHADVINELAAGI